jgi:replicative DNA helicase
MEEVDNRVTGKVDVIGYRCSISRIDKILCGFQKGKSYYVGALKKTGKSKWMVYLSSQFLLQGAQVMLNSLEMGPRDLNKQRYSYHSGVDMVNATPEELKANKERIQHSNNLMLESPWHICRCVTIEELKAEIAHQKVNGGCDVVFVDFIQMMRSPDHKTDRVREVESIARGLADIARAENVCMIPLTQFRGEAEKLPINIVPKMSHAKESQAIGETCDWFLTLHNFSKLDSPFDESGNYIIQKFGIRLEGRYNASGTVVPVAADLRTCRFSNIQDTPADEEPDLWQDRL